MWLVEFRRLYSQRARKPRNWLPTDRRDYIDARAHLAVEDDIRRGGSYAPYSVEEPALGDGREADRVQASCGCGLIRL